MVMFSSYERNTILQQLNDDAFDVLVVGGGITGAGIALDAASRGLKTGLIEMQDFASGTSSRSTKLVHGGLRYLKQLEVKLVSDVGKERAIVYENAPHITTPEWMLLPFYKKGTFGPLSTNLGLLTYDLLAKVNKKERRKILKPHEAIEIEPLLNKKGLKGAGYYVEYKTDDARLTIEVLKKAVQKGATVINYVKAVELFYNEKGKVNGVKAQDQIDNTVINIAAKKVINATGPWVDQLRELDHSKDGKALYLAKGVHLVFSKEVLPINKAIYFDTPDGRMIFAIPRHNKTYVGTTDTAYSGDIAHPTVTEEDRNYLLEAIRHMFPTIEISGDDVESSWAGIRPLIAEDGKDPDEISRKDEIFVSKSGLLSMAGGKLTGYRQMAEKVVDLIVKQIKEEEGILYSRSETARLPISGGEVGGAEGFMTFKKDIMLKGTAFGLQRSVVAKLVRRYGANVETIFQLLMEKMVDAKKENIDPIVFAELCYAIKYEMVYKPTDFFIRRTGALYFEIDWVKRYKRNVIRYMEKALNWSKEQTKTYTDELNQLLYEAVTPVKSEIH